MCFGEVGDIALHNGTVRNVLSMRPVFAFSRLDREFAARFKAAKVAYVVPSRQVFLPPTAILESARAYAEDEKPLGAHLTPWAQVVLLDCLLHERLPGVVWFSALRGRLNITPVNLSRAARELERRSLARTIRIHSSSSAERLRTFISSIEVNKGEWQSVLDSLGDPSGNMEDYLLAFRRHFAL